MNGQIILLFFIGAILFVAEVFHEIEEAAYYKRLRKRAEAQRDSIIRNIGRYSIEEESI